jgi:hypothetical protein
MATVAAFPALDWSFAKAACQLDPVNKKVKHVIYIQFDNVHFRRDNPNVPSDLEQIPNLLNFLETNGTLATNHHAVLISHTADDIVASMTGLYGDRSGLAVSNSFGVFDPTSTTFPVEFAAAFVYWTDKVSEVSFEPPSVDSLPVLVTKNSRGGLKNTPAPWVPFTRAGCDVGAFSIANIEFEGATTTVNGNQALTDVVNVYGASSTQAAEPLNNQVADFEGESLHCAKNSSRCSGANGGIPDLLPDEPNGYHGFNGLFGAKYLAPAAGQPGGFTDLNGNVITNADSGLVGFSGFDPSASQTLGAVAEMQEAGIPVTYAYIADAHDDHVNDVPFGPGEAGYVAQLAAYNTAFGQFFTRLTADGITPSNTLFIITADEGDHFVGSQPTNPGCDGVTTPCTYPINAATGEEEIGEFDADLTDIVLDAGDATPFNLHFDDAPPIYINGDETAVNFSPGTPDPLARGLEQTMGPLQIPSPITLVNETALAAMADPAEEKLLHMVTADPLRTPNFTYFGNPDFFFDSGLQFAPFCSIPPIDGGLVCEDNGFAWNHGDIQPEIGGTWLGLVGPGVNIQGQTGAFFSDHADDRPTILTLVGLTDDYEHDGRVLTQALSSSAVPPALEANITTATTLGRLYKELNAPFGTLAKESLIVSTNALDSTSSGDATYIALDNDIVTWTNQRDNIAGKMKTILDDAAFQGTPINVAQANNLITQAQGLINKVTACASGGPC